MPNNTKDLELQFPVYEFVVSGNEYNLGSTEPVDYSYYARVSNDYFRLIPSTEYTVETVGINYILTIDSDFLADKEKIQICKKFSVKAQELSGTITLDQLQENYNILVRDFAEFIDGTRKIHIKTDNKDFNYVFPELKINETWYCNENGELGTVDIVNFDEFLAEAFILLDEYTETKKTELNTYNEEQKTELDTHTNAKKTELDTHTNAKKGQLDTYTTEKIAQIEQSTETNKTEINDFNETQKTELVEFTGTQKTEVTNFANTTLPSNVTPKADTRGGNAGISTDYSRGDHSHPRELTINNLTDITKYYEFKIPKNPTDIVNFCFKIYGMFKDNSGSFANKMLDILIGFNFDGTTGTFTTTGEAINTGTFNINEVIVGVPTADNSYIGVYIKADKIYTEISYNDVLSENDHDISSLNLVVLPSFAVSQTIISKNFSLSGLSLYTPIGGILELMTDDNPSDLFSTPTTWEKLVGTLPQGTTGADVGVVSGNNQVTLVSANVPPHGHTATVGTHIHAQGTHSHNFGCGSGGTTDYGNSQNQAMSNRLEVNCSASASITSGSSTPAFTVADSGSATPEPINLDLLTITVNRYKRLS